MSSPRVTVPDFGIGNLYSVCRALEKCGAEVELVETCPPAERVERLILPGVGAFAKCLDAMQAHGVVDLVREFALTGRPMLGICVGMQAFFEVGEEFGQHPGIGLLPGRVQRLAPVGGAGAGAGGGSAGQEAGDAKGGAVFKLPHIGWAPLETASQDRWNAGPLRAVAPGDYVYFVHSFHAVPDDPGMVLATTGYGGASVTAAVAHGNITGLQFHPERSGPVGLRILEGFVTS